MSAETSGSWSGLLDWLIDRLLGEDPEAGLSIEPGG